MAKNFEKACVIGGGVIGSSFTLLFAMGKMDVKSYNRSLESEAKTKKIIEKYVDELIEKKVVTEDKETILSRISYTTNEQEAIEFADIVEECIPENYDVKKEFVKVFEKYSKPDAVLCSATSGLLVTKIAEDAERPERIFGAHPYNPPHLIPLIEISQGEKSDPEIANALRELFVRLGKKPIIIRNEVPGFIANRLQAVVMREMMDLVDKGVVSMEDCETALTFGPAIRWAIMGPGQIFELGGGEHGLQGLLDHIGPSMETWLEDAATWTKFTDEIKKKTVDGVHEAIKNRPADIGNTHETLAKYRDG
ncbi:MAG: 3-hydroxyacyl-CoA dehydrogenase family protein, partial [Finegoldia magna]|uniref:3-hydroxyacyl-CoA dehydrogenase family protein n=1 Tax=Finegoldia magna TaxID=1260 RepID=UPI002911461D